MTNETIELRTWCVYGRRKYTDDYNKVFFRANTRFSAIQSYLDMFPGNTDTMAVPLPPPIELRTCLKGLYEFFDQTGHAFEGTFDFDTPATMGQNTAEVAAIRYPCHGECHPAGEPYES